MLPSTPPEPPPEPVVAAISAHVVLPGHLPADCILRSAADYVVPPLVMVAILKTESNGLSVVGKNKNGSLDVGVAQHNTKSWVPYFQKNYGITAQDLLNSPCQSIRAQAYALRYEMNSKKCGGLSWADSVWCGVMRYHAPNNPVAARSYLAKVRKAYAEMVRLGRF